MGLKPIDLLHPRWSFTRGEFEQRRAGVHETWEDWQHLIAKLAVWIRACWLGKKDKHATPEQLLGWPVTWYKKRRR